jgi:RHH-type rel operon transcriptional repressor/antitoxin RelB
MSTAMVSVRLQGDLKDRLDVLASTTGRPASYYLREPLEQHITELEYAYALRAEVEAARRGETQTISHADLKTELGLV